MENPRKKNLTSLQCSSAVRALFPPPCSRGPRSREGTRKLLLLRKQPCRGDARARAGRGGLWCCALRRLFWQAIKRHRFTPGDRL